MQLKTKTLTIALLSLATLTTLSLAGCATVADTTTSSTATKTTNQTVQTEQVAIDNVMSEREKLVGLLIDKISVKDYLKMTQQINSQDKIFINCINSDETYTKVLSALKPKLQEIINHLTDDEVKEYLKLNKNSQFYQKYYELVIEARNRQIEGQKPSPAQLKEQMADKMTDTDFVEYFEIYLLPNKPVKSILFPMIDGDFQLFKFLKQTVESNCQ